MKKSISQCSECKKPRVKNSSDDQLENLVKIGSSLKGFNELLCCRDRGYKLLKLLMHGNNLQIFYIRKGYESGNGDARRNIFNLEQIVINFLQKFAETHLSEQERKFFAYAVFKWLIKRYDLKNAYKLLAWTSSKEQSSFWFYCSLILIIILLLFFSSIFYSTDYSFAKGLFIAGSEFLFILFGLIFYLSDKKRNFYTALHILVPRLAITTMVGFLFILASDSVQKLISNSPYVWGLMSFIVAALYCRIELAGKLNDHPKEIELWSRIMFLMMISIMWSLLIITLVGFLRHAMSIELAMPALAIGVTLEGAWHEKTITEPI